MNDEADKPEEEPSTQPEAEPQGPRGGERLAEARREQQISVLEIAKELHLDEPKVRALENNDFETLGAPVFAKGHLRKYSQLVGINHEDVLTDYYKLTRAQSMPPVVTSRSKPQREMSPGPWIAGIIVIVVAVIAYWVIATEPFSGELPAAQVPAAAPVTAPAEDQAATEDAGDEEPAVEVPDEVEPSTTEQQESPVAVVAASRPPPAVAEGDVRLSITFTGDCWTEVYDAGDRRLYFGMGREGRTVNVSGNGPLSALFGDADNVSLRVNGSDFTIADADRRGRTARLMLYGS